ncbi:hypothetical protein [Solitalea koreensis]|nr:hypothetical protein [Solitalea koreensis]
MLCLIYGNSFAQQSNDVQITANTSISTLTINSVNTYTSPLAVTGDLLKIDVANNNGASLNTGWRLSVRANQNFTSGSNTIPINEVMAEVNRVGSPYAGEGSVGPVALGLTDQNLIVNSGYSGARKSQSNLNITFKTTGGSNLFKPAGTYTATLTFRITYNGAYYNETTATVNLVLTNVTSLTPSSGSASFSITAPTHYQNGVTLNLAGNLSAFSNLPFSITAQASQDLTRTGGGTIPVGNIKLTLSPQTGTAVTKTLTTSSTTFYLNTPGDAPVYDLIFSSDGGNNAFMNLTPGTYTTSITFTLTPQSGTAINISRTLNVIIAQAVGITLNNSAVNFNYSTPSAYTSAQTISQSLALTTFSTKPYTITVQANSNNLTNGANTIPISDVEVLTTTNVGTLTTITNLGTTARTMISNAPYTFGQNWDLKYTISAAKSQSYLGKPTGVYSGTIIYTITSP